MNLSGTCPRHDFQRIHVASYLKKNDHIDIKSVVNKYLTFVASQNLNPIQLPPMPYPACLLQRWSITHDSHTHPWAQCRPVLCGCSLVPTCETRQTDQHGFVDTRSNDVLFDPNRLNLDESSSICRLESAELVHRRLVFIVQTLRISSNNQPSAMHYIPAHQLTSSLTLPSTTTFPLYSFNRTSPFTVL